MGDQLTWAQAQKVVRTVLAQKDASDQVSQDAAYVEHQLDNIPQGSRGQWAVQVPNHGNPVYKLTMLKLHFEDQEKGV
jgi:hypothetical protein